VFAPQDLGELLAGNRSSVLCHEVGEQQPSLPPGKAPLVDDDAIALRGDPTREENLQLRLLVRFLP
jgi:hypothetical protein